MFDRVTNEAVQHEAEKARQAIQDAAYCYMTPHAIMRPRIFIDGNAWCALYGENLQDGVAGFGRSPDEAMRSFDHEWQQRLFLEDT